MITRLLTEPAIVVKVPAWDYSSSLSHCSSSVSPVCSNHPPAAISSSPEEQPCSHHTLRAASQEFACSTPPWLSSMLSQRVELNTALPLPVRSGSCHEAFPQLLYSGLSQHRDLRHTIYILQAVKSDDGFRLGQTDATGTCLLFFPPTVTSLYIPICTASNLLHLSPEQ